MVAAVVLLVFGCSSSIGPTDAGTDRSDDVLIESDLGIPNSGMRGAPNEHTCFDEFAPLVRAIGSNVFVQPAQFTSNLAHCGSPPGPGPVFDAPTPRAHTWFRFRAPGEGHYNFSGARSDTPFVARVMSACSFNPPLGCETSEQDGASVFLRQDELVTVHMLGQPDTSVESAGTVRVDITLLRFNAEEYYSVAAEVRNLECACPAAFPTCTPLAAQDLVCTVAGFNAYLSHEAIRRACQLPLLRARRDCLMAVANCDSSAIQLCTESYDAALRNCPSSPRISNFVPTFLTECRAGLSCDPATALAVGAPQASVTTPSDFRLRCADPTAEVRLFAFVPPSDGTYRVDLDPGANRTAFWNIEVRKTCSGYRADTCRPFGAGPSFLHFHGEANAITYILVASDEPDSSFSISVTQP